MPEDRFFGFLDLLFATQQQWARASDPLKALNGLGRQAGLSEAEASACLNDEAMMTKILVQRKEAAEVYLINSTPSFMINGEKYTGAQDFENIDSHLKTLEE